MKVNAMFSIIPIGAGVSLSNHIAACERVLMESGLKTQLHAHGTNIEGDWDEVLGAINQSAVDVITRLVPTKHPVRRVVSYA